MKGANEEENSDEDEEDEHGNFIRPKKKIEEEE